MPEGVCRVYRVYRAYGVYRVYRAYRVYRVRFWGFGVQTFGGMNFRATRQLQSRQR